MNVLDSSDENNRGAVYGPAQKDGILVFVSTGFMRISLVAIFSFYLFCLRAVAAAE